MNAWAALASLFIAWGVHAVVDRLCEHRERMRSLELGREDELEGSDDEPASAKPN